MSQLTIKDLVICLNARKGPRYTELVVFADDLEEVAALRVGELPLDLTPLDHAGQRFTFRDQGKVFSFEISEAGTARLATDNSKNPPSSAMQAMQDEALSAVASAALRNAVAKKGGGWAPGLVLGMLLGESLPGDSGSRRVLTLRFDSVKKRWSAYDGGLVRWMKRELAPAAAAE
ncbi:MAG: hypothetical protein KDK70_17490 [Myxococcales bacterium]|nr:hypothetical protein [Myxococcales bacterium]